jgi:hypothetical protein
MMRPTHALWFGIFAAIGFACGPGDGSVFGSEPNGAWDGSSPNLNFDDSGFGDASVQSLEFDPPSQTLLLDGITPKTATFNLKAHLSNGNVVPVKAQSISFNRPDLAKMNGFGPVDLVAGGAFAGTGTLQAIVGTASATATLTVNVHVVQIGTGVTQTAVQALDGATTQDPKLSSLLYPYDATVFPLGLSAPLVMWNAPSASDAYKLHYEENGYVYDGYFLASLPEQWRVDQLIWDHLTASNQGDPLKLAVARFDGTNAYQSAHESFTIVPSSLRGAIYYWTTSGGGHMSRIRPGTGSQPEVLSNGKCMGCHAVSADGTTLVATVDDLPSTDGLPMTKKRAWESFDLPDATSRQVSTLFGGNLAVTPDGKYTVFGNQILHIADTSVGTEIANTGLETVKLDPNMKGLMTPVFSPDGKRFAAIEGGAIQTGSGTWYHDLTGGKLVMMDFDEKTVAFSNLTSLAAVSAFPTSEQELAYPTFTPDGQYIAFHVGNYTTGCNQTGCVDSTTQLGEVWLQNVNGSAPIKLTKLDTPPATADANLSFEPTFNPVQRGNFDWVVFTSERDWGNRITGTANNGKKRLWVAAIDPSTNGPDPSHPPFFLEGQEEDTTNMRGFWALAACIPTKGGGACQAGFECCSGFCDQGVCVDVNQFACKSLGDVCGTSSDCCNDDKVSCLNGVCTVPPVN